MKVKEVDNPIANILSAFHTSTPSLPYRVACGLCTAHT